MVQISHLYFSYTGLQPYILEDLSLEIPKGTYLSVLGENGCGKSTLIRSILGFLKPTSGEILTDAKRIGYVAQIQDNGNADFPITVFEMLNSYRRLLHIRDKDCIMERLKQVHMEAHAHKLMGTLSGGQAQKIRLARALMGGPDLLVLDEPSTGVDVTSQREIYGFLKKLHDEHQVTIISIEHNLPAAMENSSLIYHMVSGHGHLCTPEQYAEEYLHRS
ncbi:MAG TPA: metal ABC transporter ATP-binding protein [Ruminococcaceae bacterium]|nr:metal ABC transporter ATP-binding protein [Oscillospiraceae bacterium]